MNDRITQALFKLFECHRIIFWYDAKKELRQEFESLLLLDVEKVEIANNEYGIKYRILREEPKKKFLIYREGPQPADIDNWLLDVQLAHDEFRTDQASIWLSELELGLEFAALVNEHANFFEAVKRRDGLKKLLTSNDSQGVIRLKMLSVCAGSDDARLDAVLKNLLLELAEQRDEKLRLLRRCGLEMFLWQQMERHYAYRSVEPGIRDFVVELFKSCYAMSTEGDVKLNADALVFLKRWKDSRLFGTCFDTLSGQCADILNINEDLAPRDFRDLIELDYFRLIDMKIISDLTKAIVDRTVSSGDVTLWVRQRRQGHWYEKFQHYYQALDYASRFLQELSDAQLTVDSLVSGIQRYSQQWYRIDQLYRKFIYHLCKSKNVSLLGTLNQKVENFYVNHYLLKVNDAFQTWVNAAEHWEAEPVMRQTQFFDRCVEPFLRKENKVCVIISDAMRYEIGEELLGLIRQEDRYSAELEPALSVLPSYTQLGMAALLPHKTLAIADTTTGNVLVDGQSAQGTPNRDKILKAALPDRAAAVTYKDMMELGRDDRRELLKTNDVLYIYHNRIDHTGDKIHSEGQAFEAAESTLGELIDLMKKLTAANASNILITADHGFIYQHREIEESDFLSTDVSGSEILYRDRRFVIGKGLEASKGLRKFTAEQLGLAGEVEVQIPTSINRLRLKGSGSRFVHGGASLQEVVIPVLRINKKRQSDVSSVDVEILRSGNQMITSGQMAVTLYQSSAATDKLQARELRAGLYTEAGALISDSHTVSFDLESTNPRERELAVRFVLTRDADEVNGQDVILRLDEKVVGTTHYKEYKSIRYRMRRSFASDFDF